MKEEIITNINEPAMLEKLYRGHRALFKRTFYELYPDIKENQIAAVWHERLSYYSLETTWGSRKDLLFVFSASVIAAVLAKIPAIFNIDNDFFYPRNIGFIIFPVLWAFFVRRNQLTPGKISFIMLAGFTGLVFINMFPETKRSDTLYLSCVHLVLFQWSVLGFAFVGSHKNEYEKRLAFLKYNGDLLVITALILIAGGIMTGITLGLFKLVGLKIEEFYFEYIVVIGLSTAPILGTFLTQTNPQLVGRVSPLIARLFSPLVLIMLIIYLIAMLSSGKDPYTDREFLMIFNVLLVGVMAIIFFSIAGTSSESTHRMEVSILLMLSVVTIIVNGVALSAILFRISEWGITPNRAALLGGNILMLIHLLLISVQLFRILWKKEEQPQTGRVIAAYLPVYFFWTIVVTFIFPFVFGFR